MRASVLLSALAALTACGPQAQPAPEDLDGNLRWFWARSVEATDAEVAEAAQKLGGAGKADTLTTDKPGRGFLSRLVPAELAVVGRDGAVDPAKARGFFVTNVFPCTLSRLEGILSALDQKAQYPEAYDAYARTYTSDVDAFRARRAPSLSWDVTLTAKLVTAPYTSTLAGGLRHVPAVGAASPGPLLVARTWLTAPATFKNPDPATGFEQDYQIELYWERSPGEVFHAYAMWRDLRLGLGLSTEDNGIANTIMTGLIDWDKRTAELCRQ
ncbi:MAG: hypothetical protein INH41_11755 [Myxococcaceae bacterium]|jgi:hypothetical protein|nr:hypothetical protein [Myxococcaceae bacterium]MCA3013058.1 hypothetical protein [Myxococcaceae bacterium]